MTTIKTTVRNRRIDVPAPSDIPDGMVVMLTVAQSADGPMSPKEIARVQVAMQKLDVWDMPGEAAADLESWERQLNRHGIEHRDPSMEDVFP